MVNAVIQNSVVSGELSPELHGRHDMKPYFQGAAKLENFVPRRTGGIRKRSGTQYLCAVSVAYSAYRTVPYLFDRSNYAILLLYLKTGSSTLFYRFIDNGTQVGDENTTGFSGFVTADLDNLRYKQVGDTFYFTLKGRRTFRCVVGYETATCEWSEMRTNVDVANAPVLDCAVEGMFAVEGGNKESARKYALWGVKNGVFSAPREVTASIVLPWAASATVTLSWEPSWSLHDYYVLGKQLGSDFAQMAAFYPNVFKGSLTDATWANSGTASTITVGETEYAAGTSTIATAWQTDPDTLANGVNATAAVINGTLSFTMPSISPILALRIWFGGKLKPSAGGTAVNVGATGAVLVTLKSGDVEIASWSVNVAYTQSDVTLSVANPQSTLSMSYTLELTNDDIEEVVVRGIIPVVDSARLSYEDTNIEPVTTTGLQEMLQVGDAGMDCELCDIWQQRLVFASSMGNPFTLWFSTVGNLTSFYASRPQTQACAFSISIPPVAATKILHMYSGQWLILFTEAGEYLCGADGSFGYSTANLQKVSSICASESVLPIDTASTLLFVGADNRSVYSMRYDLSRDGVIPIELSVFARHLTEGKKIVRMAYQRYPDSVAWCLLDDGSLLSVTWEPDQEVLAWARHTFEASAGLVLKDIVSLNAVRETEDCEVQSEVILVWESEDEDGRVYFERMRSTPCVDNPTVSMAKCVDHAGYPAAVFPGDVDPEVDVKAEFVTLRPESQNLNTMGIEKTILGTTFRLFRSGKIDISPLRGGLDASIGGDVVVEDARVSLNTGDVDILPRSFFNDGGQMVIRSADNNPCEIQSVRFRVQFDSDDMQD